MNLFLANIVGNTESSKTKGCFSMEEESWGGSQRRREKLPRKATVKVH